jgi:Leucine-rich repeat (LRR) protein
LNLPWQITDAGLAHLAGLNQLQWLNLDRTQITDGGLAGIAGLTQLQSLNLDRTQITDAGLAHLAGLTQLRDLRLRNNPQVTDEGVKKLQQALPKCRIIH